MPLEDKQTWRLCWREIAKRDAMDTSRLVISCINMIVDLSGVLKVHPTARGVDLKKEVDTVSGILMQLPKVRDVTTRNLRFE